MLLERQTQMWVSLVQGKCLFTEFTGVYIARPGAHTRALRESLVREKNRKTNQTNKTEQHGNWDRQRDLGPAGI